MHLFLYEDVLSRVKNALQRSCLLLELRPSESSYQQSADIASLLWKNSAATGTSRKNKQHGNDTEAAYLAFICYDTAATILWVWLRVHSHYLVQTYCTTDLWKIPSQRATYRGEYTYGSTEPSNPELILFCTDFGIYLREYCFYPTWGDADFTGEIASPAIPLMVLIFICPL